MGPRPPGSVAAGTSKTKSVFKRISSLILFTVWLHTKSYIVTTERTQQTTDWHEDPELPRRTTNYTTTLRLAQHPPPISACLQGMQHTVSFRSQREAFIRGQELRGFSGWWFEVFWSILSSESQNMDLQCQKQVQETTTLPTSSLATSASQLVHKAHKSH